MSNTPQFRKSSLTTDHPATPEQRTAAGGKAKAPAGGAVKAGDQTHHSGGVKQRMPFQAHPNTLSRIRATEHAARLHEGYATMSEWMEAAMLRECSRIEHKYNDGQPYPIGGTPRKGRPAAS